MRAIHPFAPFALLAVIASSTLLSCSGGKVQLLAPGTPVRALGTTTVVASEFTLHRIDGAVDEGTLSRLPAVSGAWSDWTVRTWRTELEGGERSALLEFLAEERGKYGAESRPGNVRERIDTILAALQSQPLDSTFVSYLYKRDRPGTSAYQYGDWLYVHFLDLRSGTITSITNAFR